jgi:hypothetical protein
MPTQADSAANVASNNSTYKNGPATNEQDSTNFEFMGSFTDLLTAPVVEDIGDDTF